MLPKKLQKKLQDRIYISELRSLGTTNELVDFSSNDYLGFSRNKTIFKNASEILHQHNLEVNGATGSRLLTGNHQLYTETENLISKFHKVESALIFNSGYDANIGFFGAVPQRGDIILYDELCHASIRDGIKMSDAKGYKFGHNDTDHLEALLSRYLESAKRSSSQEVYVVTESVFSMDGDSPNLQLMASVCEKHKAHFIVDEAHAFGVLGKNGEGLVQKLGLENYVFARLVTFGKALGCHGAAILGTNKLKEYLINFTRSFIYTTGLPPHSVATIKAAYHILAIQGRNEKSSSESLRLHHNIAILRLLIKESDLENFFILSSSAIHSFIVTGNTKTKRFSEALKKEGFDVKPILSPTVPKGQERLRICVHSYNTEQQLKTLVAHLSTFVK